MWLIYASYSCTIEKGSKFMFLENDDFFNTVLLLTFMSVSLK